MIATLNHNVWETYFVVIKLCGFKINFFAKIKFNSECLAQQDTFGCNEAMVLQFRSKEVQSITKVS